MTNKKNLIKYLICLIVFTVFISNFFFVCNVSAAYKLEVDYPTIDGTTPTGGLGGYMNYLYVFGLALVGVAAVGALVFGGIVYMTAGSISSADEAKKWIWGALAGLLLAFCAYLILYAINPDLVRFGSGDGVDIVSLETHQCKSDADCNVKAGQRCDLTKAVHQCVSKCEPCYYLSKGECKVVSRGTPCVDSNQSADNNEGTCDGLGKCITGCIHKKHNNLENCNKTSRPCCPGYECKTVTGLPFEAAQCW